MSETRSANPDSRLKQSEDEVRADQVTGLLNFSAITPPTAKELRHWFTGWLRVHHDADIEDVEATETPGYWIRKEPCPGLGGGCLEPLHGMMFNEGPVRHTICFRDPNRWGGRFSSPYRTWALARAGWSGSSQESERAP